MVEDRISARILVYRRGGTVLTTITHAPDAKRPRYNKLQSTYRTRVCSVVQSILRGRYLYSTIIYFDNGYLRLNTPRILAPADTRTTGRRRFVGGVNIHYKVPCPRLIIDVEVYDRNAALEYNKCMCILYKMVYYVIYNTVYNDADCFTGRRARARDP